MKKKYRLTLDFEVQAGGEKKGESLTMPPVDRVLDYFINKSDTIKKDYNMLLSAIIMAGNDVWGNIDEVKKLKGMTDEDILSSIFKRLPSYESAYLLKLLYGELRSRDNQIEQCLLVEDIYNSLRAQNNIKVVEIEGFETLFVYGFYYIIWQ
jgi:hypothetical protein